MGGKGSMTEPGAISPERAERPLVLAVDIGSSSVRAAIHDRRGRTVRGCVARVRYTWEAGPDGAVRLPLPTALDLVGEALDRIAVIAGALAGEVVAGGISCFFHSIVGLDGSGHAVTPVLSWSDTTSARDAAVLRGQVDAAAVHACTGAPIHASYWPARVRRLRRERPTIRRWAGLPDLLVGSMTGRAVVSRSMASGTGLLDRARGSWAEGLLEQIGVAPSQLPAIVGDDEPVGPLAGAAADRWPSFAKASWFPAWGDGACGNVGLGAVRPGSAALMVGTSGALRTVVPVPAPAVGPGLFAYRLGDGTLLGGQLSEGGGVLAWASQLLRRSPAELDRAAERLDADAHGLTVLPYTVGERGIGYHDDARGAFVGLTAGTDAAAIHRALLESIAYGFVAIDERLSETSPSPLAVTASGGALTHSPLLAQILADVLGRDIALARGAEASRRGAALLALQGAGVVDSLESVPGPVTQDVRFDPDRSARYRAARARQERLYDLVLGRPS